MSDIEIEMAVCDGCDRIEPTSMRDVSCWECGGVYKLVTFTPKEDE